MTILIESSPSAVSSGSVCEAWATTADVCSPCNDYALDSGLLEDKLLAASETLYILSDSQFSGGCSVTIRPCSATASWDWRHRDYISFTDNHATTWGSCSCRSWDTCSCPPLSELRLPHGNVSEVTQVKVDGAVLTTSLYRLDPPNLLVSRGDPWPCFPAGTLVLTSRGLRPIEEIQAGERVLTHRNRWRRVLRAGKTGESETVRVTGRGGIVTSTPDHRFWAAEVAGVPGKRKLGASEWRQAQELLGYAWAMPRATERLLTPLPDGWRVTTKEFWWMVGRWVGDGWLASRGKSVLICSGQHEADALEANLLGVGRSWKRSEERTTTRFRLADSSLYEWLASEFKTGAANKEIPPWLLGCERWIREAFLEGFVSADGWKGQAKRGRPFTSVRTVSRKLAVSLKLLVAGLGYAPTYYEAPQTTTHIEGREVNGLPTYRVDWPEGKPGEPYSQVWADDAHLWGRVRKVELDETVVDVYDLEVEDDNSFVADGMVVHNCCQDIELADTQENTWSVTYNHGLAPPLLGVTAAAILACEFYMACEPEAFEGQCRLPSNVISVARQGVTIAKLVGELFIRRPGQQVRFGIPEIDLFLATYGNGGSIIVSPDDPPVARIVGT